MKMTATTTILFEPEIEQVANGIKAAAATGENDPFQYASMIADGVERMLERYFPDLATANALDPQDTVERLLELCDAVHGDTANQLKP